jgi:membrane protease YdiL (CAAX protease family)
MGRRSRYAGARMSGVIQTPRLSPTAPYGVVTTRPLHILVFLLPLMVLYELGAYFYLAGEARGADTIGARDLLGSFFESFGVARFYLPPLALSAVLLAWHLLLRDPWRIRWSVLAMMALESALWAIPLLVFGLLLRRAPAAAGTDEVLHTLTWQARLTISLGAGIYEELLFRLILITVVHFLLVDIMHAKPGVGFAVGAVVSSLAFAFYHNISQPGGGVNLGLVVFLTAAGLYFSTVFILRGFGVVVATHALYDIVALLVFENAR